MRNFILMLAVMTELCAVSPLHAQCSVSGNFPQKYWVFFSDKHGTPFSKSDPAQFLSQRSIARRQRMHIPIRDADLPVNPVYLDSITALGIPVLTASRWLNAASVEINSAAQITLLSALPFVRGLQPVRRLYEEPESDIPVDNASFYRVLSNAQGDYGPSYNQIHMIDLDFLHKLGLDGSGMVIAQLDAGWYGIDFSPAFQEFWDDGRILGMHNYPDDNDSVFAFSTHGSNVLSIMGADVPGTYIGAAPGASFYLFRTEIVDSERVAEEDFWMQAAEDADALGADIINSSLGYTTFDDSTENHTYADMDGNTTVCTIAADAAAKAGILVCNSAGNEGASSWHFIGAPADGDSVFTIGAVDADGNYASFSSVGPTYDGRLKPNVSAQGSGSAVLDAPSSTVTFGSGTSYSSPLIAGACACLWEAFPGKSNMDIIQAVQESATLYHDPNYELGYGIPDFGAAYYILKGFDPASAGNITLAPNPASDQVVVLVQGDAGKSAVLYITDMEGRRVFSEDFRMRADGITPVLVQGLGILASGMYVVSVPEGTQENSALLFVR